LSVKRMRAEGSNAPKGRHQDRQTAHPSHTAKLAPGDAGSLSPWTVTRQTDATPYATGTWPKPTAAW
jgi:hypothetical protein